MLLLAAGHQCPAVHAVLNGDVVAQIANNPERVTLAGRRGRDTPLVDCARTGSHVIVQTQMTVQVAYIVDAIGYSSSYVVRSKHFLGYSQNAQTSCQREVSGLGALLCTKARGLLHKRWELGSRRAFGSLGLAGVLPK